MVAIPIAVNATPAVKLALAEKHMVFNLKDKRSAGRMK
jgi:hypothetical protein